MTTSLCATCGNHFPESRPEVCTVCADERQWLPPGGQRWTTLAELAAVAGARWGVEDCFAEAKGEAGLDHYQVRRYDAWYRHATLAVLAHAYLAVTAANAPKALAAASSRSRSRRSAVYWHT